jgi:signal transduction histidine kinase
LFLEVKMAGIDTAQGPLSPELEDVIAFRLAKKALRYMGMLLAPLLGIAVWLGYDNYQGYSRSTEKLVQETQNTTAKADTLRALIAALQQLLHDQTVALASNNLEAEASRSRLQAYYGQLTQQTDADRNRLLSDRFQLISEVRSALDSVGMRSAMLQQSFTGLHSATQAQVEQMLSDADSANERAQRAVRIAEESGVQTVGARHRQELYGTPFDVYFTGVSRDALRDVVVSRHNGAAIHTTARLTSNDVIEIPLGNLEYRIRVVNVLDIPGGLLRITGSSRTDAATFRVERVAGVSAPIRRSALGAPQQQ